MFTRDSVAKMAHELKYLRSLLYRDDLTGLANGRAFRAAVPQGAGGSVVLIDLDHFKAYQDRLGSHLEGDRVLCEFGQFLGQVVPRPALEPRPARIARLHGDEFALWLDDEQEANTVRERILDWECQGGGVTASCGVGPTLGEADRAMYTTKARRR